MVILIFLLKKADFRVIFRLFTASVRSQPPGPPAVSGVFPFSKLIKLKMNQSENYPEFVEKADVKDNSGVWELHGIEDYDTKIKLQGLWVVQASMTESWP